jgi:hypothetical protein
MSFAFATCERIRALGFLKKIYPSSVVEDSDSSVKELLDIIEADEIRVCDPDFHGGQIIQGTNWNDTTHERATAAQKERTNLWWLTVEFSGSEGVRWNDLLAVNFNLEDLWRTIKKKA